jgi:thiamine-phosphate pyrophosphorylase
MRFLYRKKTVNGQFGMNSRNWPGRGIYALTPDTQDTQDLLGRVGIALENGIALLQYRNKSRDPGLRLEQAQALVQLCREHQVPCIINDDLALALRVEADGLHLGQDDGPLAPARAALGKEAIIGRSCYNSLALAQTAANEGADYLAFGRFYPSSTKPDNAQAQLSLLTEARARFPLPLVAIGGIRPDNAEPLIRAGASYLALIGGLFQAADIAAACQQLNQLFAIHQEPES